MTFDFDFDPLYRRGAGLHLLQQRTPGLCIRFKEPVPGLEATGRLRHPGLTVTVADVEGAGSALAAG